MTSRAVVLVCADDASRSASATGDISIYGRVSDMSIRSLIFNRIVELEEETRRTAHEAGGARWRVGPLANCECCSQVINDGSVQVLTVDGLLAEYVVYWDPEEILRNLAEDRDVLTRHSLAFDNEECKCGYDYESCPDVLSLARRRRIPLGGP